MRHRSPLMQADLSSIPKGSTILAAKLVVMRAGEPGPKAGERTPFKPNMWVAEPCNRDWDEKSANCYSYAPGKLWKAVSGLYYGEDPARQPSGHGTPAVPGGDAAASPDYQPVFAAYGPAGTGAANVWDFTEALKFWLVPRAAEGTDGAHVNHGFFLYGDSIDYMRIFTTRAKDVKQRPAIMVIYERR
jgi:hypothetical protein